MSSRLAAALVAAGDVGYVWDIRNDAIEWLSSPAPLGLAPETVATGEDFARLINPEDLAQRQHRLDRHFVEGEAYAAEYRLRGGRGESVWVQDRGAAERDAQGRAVRLLGVLRMITGRKEQEWRLEQLANFDELTGHFNRARLKEAIHHVLAYSRRANVPGAYLAVGIDNMTMVNDAFGSAAADAVIVELGNRLDRCLGLNDIIGRIGGDRFGILLGSCPEDRIVAAAERVLAAASRLPVVTEAGPIYVTVSIGSIAFPSQAETAQDVMTRAETALVAAKRAGRDCLAQYRLSEKERMAHRASMAIGERVQRALKDGRIILAYQPVVHGGSAEVDYYECLLRLREDDGTITAAGDFVPMIERLGFIRQLDRYVLEKTVEELAATPDIALGFNISGLTVADRQWLRAIASLLRNRPAIARRIVIEITETAALNDLDEAARFVATLRELGCRVALDDFGAGFTSLRHLQSLGVDTVKIDGSFVRNLATSPQNQLFLRHLLGLATSLGLSTVAECVETEEDARILCDEGVGYLQGFLFGKPTTLRPWQGMPVAEPAPLSRAAS